MESIKNFINENAEFHNTKILEDFCSLANSLKYRYEYVHDKLRELQRIQKLSHLPDSKEKENDILNIYIPPAIKKYYELKDELELVYKQIKIS